ncbi:MAG: ParB/RepB/Spo0J family partition protein [Phycisphaerae bacterium]|jgi:ParB family chromosome partitioning protein
METGRSRVTITHLALDRLIPTADNPRVIREDAAFAELVQSVRSQGVLQPLIARPVNDALAEALTRPEAAARGPLYDLRAGHRRLLAAKAAGLATVPVIVREMDDRTAMEVTIAENLQRENLQPLEEANGIRRMLELGWTPEAIGERFGKTPAWVAKRSRLNDLSPAWKKALSDDREHVSTWPAALLDQVARLPAASQDQLLERLSGGRFSEFPRLPGQKGAIPTSAELNRFLAAQILRTLRGAPWKLDDFALLPAAGACANCPKRSSAQPLLFDDLDDGAKRGRTDKLGHDRCLDSACYQAKLDAHVRRRIDALKAEHKRVLPVVEDGDGGLDYRERQALKKRFPDLAESYGWQPTPKPGEQGAVCGVIIHGPAAGTERWVWNNGQQPAPQKGPGHGKREASKPTPLAERRKALSARRAAHVITAIRERLDKLERGTAALPKALTAPARAIALAAIFGTSEKQDSGHNRAAAASDWNRLDAGRDCGPAELVRCVLPVLHTRLNYFNGEAALQRIADARRIAALIEMDYAGLEREAAEAIPTPKGWASLRPDGTPKAAAGTKDGQQANSDRMKNVSLRRSKARPTRAVAEDSP